MKTLEQVLSENPTLSAHGFEEGAPMTDAYYVERVNAAVAWLVAKDVKPSKVIKANSYDMKHVAERDIGYLSNGCFIAAALMLEYPAKRYKVSHVMSKNMMFGMSVTRR